MKNNISDIYKVFSTNETLLRLLINKPVDPLDDPLSPDKPNILDMDNQWDLIEDVIRTSPTVSGLDSIEKCRICFYPSRRKPQSRNYLVADQQIKFDIFAHYAFNDKDQRLAWICDVVNEILNNKRITGVSDMLFIDGNELAAPDNYVAYRLIYQVGSVN